MAEDITTLHQAISQYETQLSQVQLAIAASLPGPDQDSLISLQSDIEELITLTKENLTGLLNQAKEIDSPVQTPIQGEVDHFDKEYALLKAELEDAEAINGTTQETVQDGSTSDIQEDLDALQGMKCQAPHKHHWGDVSYHNALVCGVEPTSSIHSMDQIQVRVMFTNPTQQDMLPCPYFLEGDCRFSDQQCRFSHGELVDLSSLKEYKEPNFSAVRPGLRILVKYDDNLWHRAVVLTSSSKSKCEVKLESSGKTTEVDLHCILPLDDGEDLELDSSNESSEDDSELEADPSLVQQSLLTTPASSAYGDWEKHTRGVGSRLMVQMGYVMGTGLGKNGEGRLEPVEAVVFPAGKSLDHCMALKEKAGGDTNLFKVERRLKRLQQKHQQQSEQQYVREKQQTNVFDFINSKLGGKRGDVCDLVSKASSTSKPSSKDKGLKSESCRGLNVVGLRVGEGIRRAERDLTRLRESLSRHVRGSPTYTIIFSKIEEKQEELDKLRASERSVDLERNQRKDCKKLTVF
ncbi:zinc finger CCCH-type with G patch domain-containing protein [Zootermopsis nevadensis]|uniref:Zinc finger CCCH-type with G patch domain-containing protein n=1 Tax=Zootermopsis nevadensis TaxID=136037 RepID=A0A067QUN9_ZOONE|nr:zinc finger CCCH-type with G patch domain-containing protein [Zootermopsis nevadensis]KDR13643.1 Zinc finger CCCH-type with G patch domain-containing protein [Zootermopsis nevadensis]